MLTLLSKIYSAASAWRNHLYQHGIFKVYQSSLPVISVGNITCGGNGKTPLVIYMAKILKERGFRPVVLSRGYGGRVKGVKLVGDEDRVNLVGDEPLLIKERTKAQVVVARNRVLGMHLIERRGLGDIVILDDGFQHRRLGRNLDIVCIDTSAKDALADFKRGQLLPAGRFREHPAGIKRAHLLVLAGRGSELEPKSGWMEVLGVSSKVLRCVVRAKEAYNLVDRSALFSKEVVAFCGIANPQGFIESLKSAGYLVRRQHFFKDHFRFRREDILELRKKYPGVALVCTEKDGVRVRELGLGSEVGVYLLPIESEIVQSEPFWIEVLKCLELKGRASTSQSRRGYG